MGDINDTFGRNCEYSGNISNEGPHSNQSGMMFRLRHLNTGRLVHVQELTYENRLIRTTGLQEHLEVEFIKIVDTQRKRVREIRAKDPKQLEILEDNSTLRLVSTGVDIDNRIRSETSV